MGTFYLIAGLLPRDWALVVGQLAQGGVVVAAAWTFGDAGIRGAARTVGLVAPRGMHVAAAILIGASCWYLDVRIGELMPWSDQGGEAQTLTEMLRDTPLVVAIVTLAVIPALCEELVFRGVLARGLATRLPPVAAAAIAAALFAGYHMSSLQAVPAFLFGLVLAMLALRARSLVPAMVAHAVNNTFVIALARDDSASGAAAWVDQNGTIALAGALVLTGAGLALLVAARPA